MSSRVLGYSLLLVLVAAISFPLIAPTQQSPDNPPPPPKWEYQVFRLDASGCSSETEVANSLNRQGQQGWELVSYERAAPSFPRDADGTLVIAPAATGPSRGVTPPTADSFQGTLAIKMGPVQPGGCRMVLKRRWRPPERPQPVAEPR
ncbi:MAG TPA: DUF4177 domain-containing protein [Candidatus Angelobacter sp.]|nr:DUF4177 domain-containing protein [Candidatus Angelobacter sp.]